MSFAVNFPSLVGSRYGRPYPSPAVYIVRGPPIRAVCRCDKPRHNAWGSLSINLYRLGEGLVKHMDRVAAPQKVVGTGTFIQIPRTGFFRRRMILRNSVGRPCRSSGGDPPPACVATRVAPKGSSSPKGLVGFHRAPCPGADSWLSSRELIRILPSKHDIISNP
jgi:hypothetical protein